MLFSSVLSQIKDLTIFFWFYIFRNWMKNSNQKHFVVQKINIFAIFCVSLRTETTNKCVCCLKKNFKFHISISKKMIFQKIVVALKLWDLTCMKIFNLRSFSILVIHSPLHQHGTLSKEIIKRQLTKKELIEE